MPELPEVETVKQALKSQLLGREIKDVVVYERKMVKTHDITDFRNLLIGQKINDLTRRGKYLIFELDDYYLLSHLRMEGKFFYEDDTGIRDAHIHVEFLLENDMKLKYEDVRKFGTFHLYPKDVDLNLTPTLAVIGPEPWADEFNVDYVMNFLKNSTRPIKSTLLVQKFVAGLGNIYADEVLFSSKINPVKKSGNLTREEAENVVHYTREILNKAITHRGTTIRTFSSGHQATGGFQNFLQVHTKAGVACPRCQTQIIKTKVGGRGTYYCPTCQPESEA